MVEPSRAIWWCAPTRCILSSVLHNDAAPPSLASASSTRSPALASHVRRNALASAARALTARLGPLSSAPTRSVPTPHPRPPAAHHHQRRVWAFSTETHAGPDAAGAVLDAGVHPQARAALGRHDGPCGRDCHHAGDPRSTTGRRTQGRARGLAEGRPGECAWLRLGPAAKGWRADAGRE